MSIPGDIECGIDIETTGLLAPDQRIVEVNASLWQHGRKLLNFTSLVDPQRSIEKEALAVHGITPAKLVGAPLWPEVATKLHAVMSKATKWVWHNGDDFDGPFIEQEFKRAGLVMPTRPAVDTMKQGIWAHHSGKKPNLAELCFACEVPYDPALAHAAEYDVDCMMECYFRAKSWGFYEIPQLAA